MDLAMLRKHLMEPGPLGPSFPVATGKSCRDIGNGQSPNGSPKCNVTRPLKLTVGYVNAFREHPCFRHAPSGSSLQAQH